MTRQEYNTLIAGIAVDLFTTFGDCDVYLAAPEVKVYLDRDEDLVKWVREREGSPDGCEVAWMAKDVERTYKRDFEGILEKNIETH